MDDVGVITRGGDAFEDRSAAPPEAADEYEPPPCPGLTIPDDLERFDEPLDVLARLERRDGEDEGLRSDE